MLAIGNLCLVVEEFVIYYFKHCVWDDGFIEMLSVLFLMVIWNGHRFLFR